MRDFNAIQEAITSGVEQLRFGDQPANLYDPITYILSLGGKRLRPALVMMGYQLSGQDPEAIVRPALAVEVFHNFTLMHDDIMDKAPLRRGKQTVHEKWNETVAILSGDTMLVKAYDLLLEVDRPYLPYVIRRFNQTATEVCEGQQIDMNFESESSVSEVDYIEMIRLKTAVLLGFSLEFGGIMAGMADHQIQTLYKIGEQMGIGFQLMDDYLDVYADKDKFGKQVGGDIISNKKTFLLINALQKANTSQKAELDLWINMNDADPAEKVKAVTAIYNDIGIPQLTKSMMDTYFDTALDDLDAMDCDDQAKMVLKQFAAQLMKREH